MNSQKFNQVFLAVVNAGVLLSVILLIIELRQNQEIAVAQIRNDISRQVVERDMYLSSSAIAPIFLKLSNGEELAGLESIQLNYAFGIVLQGLENIYYQYEAGMYTDEEFQSVERRLESLPSGLLNYYRERRSDFSISFQRAMARIHDFE